MNTNLLGNMMIISKDLSRDWHNIKRLQYSKSQNRLGAIEFEESDRISGDLKRHLGAQHSEIRRVTLQKMELKMEKALADSVLKALILRYLLLVFIGEPSQHMPTEVATTLNYYLTTELLRVTTNNYRNHREHK